MGYTMPTFFSYAIAVTFSCHLGTKKLKSPGNHWILKQKKFVSMIEIGDIREIIHKVNGLTEFAWIDYYYVKLKYDLALEIHFSIGDILLITQLLNQS